MVNQQSSAVPRRMISKMGTVVFDLCRPVCGTANLAGAMAPSEGTAAPVRT